MDGRGSELNEGGLSGCAGAEPKIGDVIEIGLTALDAGPLRLKGVVRNRTTDGFRVEFLADTPDERRELSLFRQFRGGLGLRESDYPRFVHIVTRR
jgi:PilZ domain